MRTILRDLVMISMAAALLLTNAAGQDAIMRLSPLRNLLTDRPQGSTHSDLPYEHANSRLKLVRFSVPGFTSTIPLGMNNLRQIVGTATSNGQAGFLLSGGTFTNIFYPGSQGTLAQGINAAGEIVGWYSDGSNFQGFIEQGGVYTSISYPGEPRTALMGINNLGQIVGIYQDSSRQQHGMLYNAGIFSTLDVPGSQSTLLTGINDAGEIVGAYCISPCPDSTGFTYVNGVFTDVKYPGAQGTAVNGVNQKGDLAGEFSPGPQGQNNQDFVYIKQLNRFSALISESQDNVASGINDNEEVVGFSVQGVRDNFYGYYAALK